MNMQLTQIVRITMLLGLLLLLLSLGSSAIAISLHSTVTVGELSVTSIYVNAGGVSGRSTYPAAEHRVIVKEDDRNTIPGPGNDTVDVDIRLLDSGNALIADGTLTIVETSEGRFEGSFINRPGGAGDATSTWALNSGTFNAEPTNKLEFEYVDANTNTNLIDSITVVGFNASISVDPAVGDMGSTVTVRVEDLDRNRTNGNNNDTVDVTVNGVTLTLDETSTMGRFVGTFVNSDTTYNASPLVDDEYTVVYTDFFRPAAVGGGVTVEDTHVIGGNTGTVSFTPTASVSPNGTITVTLIDPDRNRNEGGSNDVIPGGDPDDQIRIINKATGDILRVRMEETSTAGQFTGTADLADFPAALNPGDELHVRYIETGTDDDDGSTPGSPTTDTRDFGPVVVRGQDGTITAPAVVPVTPGELPITVVDQDENANSGTSPADTVTIRADLCASGDCNNITATVNLNLNEDSTTDNAGEFVRNWTNYQAALGGVNGDVIRLTYTDAFAFNGDTNVERFTDVLLGDTGNATLTVEPTLTGPNTNVTVTVVDNDLAGIGSVDVSVENFTDGTVPFTVALSETGTPGRFRTQVNVNANNLNSAVGDVIRFTYRDEDPASGTPAPLDLTADVTIANLGNTATLTVTDTIPGRPIKVELYDPDLGQPEFVELTVKNITNDGTVETLRLGTIGEDGRFEGVIATAFGTGSDGLVDGIIAVKGGDIVRFTYRDSLNSTGSPVDVTADSVVVSRRETAQVCNQGTETTSPVWFAEYYPNTELAGDPAVIAEEQNLSVNWEETAPFREIPADNWTGRWVTRINVTQFGKYRFRVGADDGVRMYIDNQLFVDQFGPGDYRTFTADVTLQVGQHEIKVEYLELGDQAQLLVDCVFLESSVLAIEPVYEQSREVLPSDVRFDEATAHITTGRINVRANPTVAAPVLDRVWIYERYPIVGITENGDWYLITLEDGRTGWIAARYVKRYEDIPVQIYPNWAGSEAELPNVEVAGYATSELVIRTSPRTGEQIGLLPPNVGFRVFARTQSGAWYRIEYNGINGWIFAPYVVLTNGTVQDLPRE